MLEYIQEMAQYFDGFRMDNLHGTQINVARYLIKEARKVNPNIIVFAELFTSCDEETAFFVKQIGINSVLK
jgi:glycogen debranching enzyme